MCHLSPVTMAVQSVICIYDGADSEQDCPLTVGTPLFNGAKYPWPARDLNGQAIGDACSVSKASLNRSWCTLSSMGRVTT